MAVLKQCQRSLEAPKSWWIWWEIWGKLGKLGKLNINNSYQFINSLKIGGCWKVPCPWDCKDCNLTPRATNLVLSGTASIPRAHPIGCNYALAQWPSVEIEELKSWASALKQENVRLVGGEKPMSACVWSVYLLLTLHHNCLHSNLARATIRDDIEARDGITSTLEVCTDANCIHHIHHFCKATASDSCGREHL